MCDFQKNSVSSEMYAIKVKSYFHFFLLLSMIKLKLTSDLLNNWENTMAIIDNY